MSLIRSSRSEPAEWIVCENSICFWRQVAVGVVREQLRQDEQRVERRPQLVGHVREELALVLRRERELLRLLLERGTRELDLLVLDLDAGVLLLEQRDRSSSSSFVCWSSSCCCWSSSSDARSVAAVSSSSSFRCWSSSCWAWSSSDCSWSSCASDCDCSSSSSVRMFALIVFSTTPIDSASCSRNASCTSVNSWNAASSTTAITWSSNRTGRTMMLRGGASPSADVIRM